MIKTDKYKKAKTQLLTSLDKECQRFFKKNNCTLELAYYDLLSGNLKSAKENFSKISDQNLRAKWELFLISLIENKVCRYPTYFELRNFLEIDIHILISHYKGEYVEKIVSFAEFMNQINPEVHKFIGRVFLNNGMKEQAMFFLNRAKETFYQDPELHFILAQIAFNEKNFDEAEKIANECLRILPNYYPARKILKMIDKQDC